jgi:pimeloyl-ACP methyl ester carboxylesterase
MELQPVELHYEEYGQGTPVIFLHGFPFDHTIWSPLVPLLESEARLVLPDLRGFGRSPVTGDVYTMRLLAEDIRLLMDRLGLEKAVLVGHSMGGYVSLAFAHAYPARVRGLGLVATQAAADTAERRQARYKTAESVTHKGARVVASDMVNRLTPKKELLRPIKSLIMQAQPAGIVGALKGMAERSELTGSLSDISVPAVVVAGLADQLLPLDKMHTLAQLLPKGWLVEVQGAGHMVMMEEPQQVAAALRQVIAMAANG